jgi:hypothetical protein
MPQLRPVARIGANPSLFDTYRVVTFALLAVQQPRSGVDSELLDYLRSEFRLTRTSAPGILKELRAKSKRPAAEFSGDPELRAQNERLILSLDLAAPEKDDLTKELESTLRANDEFRRKLQKLQRQVASQEPGGSTGVFVLETDC